MTVVVENDGISDSRDDSLNDSIDDSKKDRINESTNYCINNSRCGTIILIMRCDISSVCDARQQHAVTATFWAYRDYYIER